MKQKLNIKRTGFDALLRKNYVAHVCVNLTRDTLKVRKSTNERNFIQTFPKQLS